MFAVGLAAVLKHVYADANHRGRANCHFGAGLSTRHGQTRLAAEQTVGNSLNAFFLICKFEFVALQAEKDRRQMELIIFSVFYFLCVLFTTIVFL